MSLSASDQRSTRRFPMKLPLAVRMPKGEEVEVSAETKDVRARGIFFYFDSSLNEGSPIEFTLTLPPEITLTESIRVKCSGKVVRVDRSAADSKIGIAAAIDQYDFVNG
jgi:hypothetical protein